MHESKSARTLTEIGRELGFSAMTISRALNGQAGISAATGEKIRAYARKVGYRPNLMARSLVLGKSMLLGAVLRSIGHPQTALVAQGIEEEAVREGYGLLLYITRGDVRLERRNLEAAGAKRVDGLILYPTDLRWNVPDPNRAPVRSLQQMGITVLAVMRPLCGVRAPAIFPDYRGAAEQAARHLLQLGHRRILYLTITTRTSFDVCEHLAGLSGVMKACGLNFDPKADVVGDQFGTLTEFAERIQTRQHTAVLCYSDDLAFSALIVLRRMGYEVPRDFSLTGFNDDPIAARCDPALTTVALPFLEMGRQAARWLMVPQQPNAVEHRTLPGQLVTRASSAPPRTS
jgi:LacI family transcriptional regulator